LGEEFYRIFGALYGLKSAPKDYQKTVVYRLTVKMEFKRLGMCACIYYLVIDGVHIILIYIFVDDFVWTGSNSALVVEMMNKYKEFAETNILCNPEKVLGMEVRRDRARRAIGLSLHEKAEDMMKKVDEMGLLQEFNLSMGRLPKVPITVSAAIIGDLPFDSGLVEEDLCPLLDKENIGKYLVLVGGLIWQIGIRNDILYAVLYASWQTHKPRRYHLKQVARMVMYVFSTREKSILWLGGHDPIELITYTDMSLNTAPNGKSVIAYGTRLGPRSGLISSKAKATVDVVLSSFEGELEGHINGVRDNEEKSYCIGGMFEAFKQAASVMNLLIELDEYPILRTIYADNEAMVNFVKGDAQGKGMKHASLRLWYVRQQLERGYELGSYYTVPFFLHFPLSIFHFLIFHSIWPKWNGKSKNGILKSAAFQKMWREMKNGKWKRRKIGTV
jgi:hypothetical protein